MTVLSRSKRQSARERVRRRLQSAGRRFRRLSADKRVVVSAMREHESWLAPGLWSLRRIGSAHRIPRHRTPAVASDRWMAGIKGSLTKRASIRVAVACAPPPVVWLRGHGGDGVATELLMTKAGGLLLFEAGASRVIHLPRKPFAADYQQRREALGVRLPVPAFQLTANRMVLTEHLVTGTPLIGCPIEVKERVTRELIVRATAIAADAHTGDSTAVLNEALATLDAATDVVPVIRALISGQRAALIEAAPSWPLVGSHGDANGLNIVVNGDDWMLIDFEDCGDLPYFYDALSPVVSDRPLARLATHGGFDEELTALTHAAGLPAPATNVALQMTAVALIAAVRHATRHGGSVGRSLSRSWLSSTAAG